MLLQVQDDEEAQKEQECARKPSVGRRTPDPGLHQCYHPLHLCTGNSTAVLATVLEGKHR